MNVVEWTNGTRAFSPDYFAARRRFVELSRTAGASVESHQIASSGPNGEALTIDTSRIGDNKAEVVVLVSSGLHGVEGGFGSAVQIETLLVRQRARFLPEKTALLLIHALNPYGYSHLRRVNENNVDLNRNFLLAGQQYADSPDGYAEFDRILNAKQPPSRMENLQFHLRAARFVRRLGMRRLKQLIAGGQYEFEKGLFYGGSGPSESARMLSEQLPRWVADAKHVVHLDFHTGLGRTATHKLLFDSCLDDRRRSWLESSFGAANIEDFSSQRTAYHIRGCLGRWCEERLPTLRSYTYVCAEFGTYSTLRVLTGLRAENQAHYWGTPAMKLACRQRLAELFCPRSVRWRTKALAQAVHLVERALISVPELTDAQRVS